MSKSVYDIRYSGDYREHLHGHEIARFKAVEHFAGRVLKLSSAARVLDYGAGSGLHAGLWGQIFPQAELYFCDISSVAMEKFQDKFPQYAGRYALIQDGAAGFDDGMFDLVVSIEVMEHVDQLVAYLQDIHRLLKPGGHFVWTTPCGNALSIEHILGTVTGKIEATPEGYRRWQWEDPTHLRRLKSREIALLLRQNGFSDVVFRFRSHLFSAICTFALSKQNRFGNWLMTLDYALFRRFPNGASMIGVARKLDQS